jgi:hypothetical protein
VLAFVDDKAPAIRELVRVTKPGGYVGLNELVAVEDIPEDVAQVARDLGTQMLSAADWQLMWLSPAWARAAWPLVTRPDLRASDRTVMGGAKALDAWAYALVAGRK